MDQSSSTLRLTHLEIEGFKSFRDKIVIGPLADFTCIIGPNGCGKSVVGEAIAFALGGNRKMLRAGSLAGLINQERRADGCKTAQVTLRLDILPTDASMPQEHLAGSPAGNDSSLQGQQLSSAAATPRAATADDLAGQPTLLDSDTPADATATVSKKQKIVCSTGDILSNTEQQRWLGIRRTLRGTSTTSHIKRPDSNSWTPISQADLQTELAAYNIQTEVVDRYIVTQSRQAVDVADAVKLVKHLELLTGTGDYETRIEEQGILAEMLANSIDNTQQQISSLEAEREQLAPHVAQWQEVQQMETEFNSTKLQLLQDQQQHGSKLINYQQDQVQKVQEAATAVSEQLKALQQQEQQLIQQEGGFNQQLSNCKKKEIALRKKVDKLSASAAGSKVQLTSAQAALKDQQALTQKLRTKVNKALTEESSYKQQVAELQQQAQQLQAARDAAQRQLADEQKAAADKAQCDAAPSKASIKGSKDSKAALQLQQQLAAVEYEVAHMEATKAAAALKATRAAESVAEAAQTIHNVESAAARSAEGVENALTSVRDAAAALEAGTIAAQQAEHEWKDAHWQQRTLQEQLQRAEADLQQYQLHSSHHPNRQYQQQRPSTSGAWPAYDAAVQHLHQRLQGSSFYVRLYNCISISDTAAASAVNTALQEVCDLNRTLIVQDRQAATAVIDHFRQQRIGTVQCKILSELASKSKASFKGFADSSSARPLLEYVTTADGLPAGFQALLDQLLGNWLLVQDRQEANRLLHLRRNLVTRSGEVFKAYGEIVVSMARSGSSSSSSTHPYALLVGQPAAISAAAQQPTAAASTVQTANSAAAAKAAQREVNQLQTQLTAAQQRAAATDSQLRATRSALLHHQQQQAAAEKLLQRLIQQQQADAARAAQVLPGLQQQLTAAQQEQQHADQALAAAAAAVDQAVEDQLELLQQLQALTGVSSNLGSNGSRRGCKGTRSTCTNINLNHAAVSGVEASLGMLTLSKAAEVLAAAEAAVGDVWQRADRAKEQQRRAGSRAAALRKKLDKMLKSAGKGIEVEKLQAKLDATEQQLQAAEAELETNQADKVLLTNNLKPVRKQLAAASRARAEAEATNEQYQAELNQQQQYLSRLQEQQKHRQAVLQEMVPQKQQQQQQQDSDMAEANNIAAVSAAAAAAAGNESEDRAVMKNSDSELADMDTDRQPIRDAAASTVGRCSEQRVCRARRRCNKQQNRTSARRRRAVVDDSSRSSSSSSSGTGSDRPDDGSSSSNASSSDAEAEESSKQRAMRHQQKHKHTHSPAAAPRAQAQGRSEVSAVALAKRGKQLQLREQQLADQEEQLQQQRSRIKEAALDRDLEALQALESALRRLQQLEQQHGEAMAAREQLLDGRYTKLLFVLQQLNVRLDDVYKQLTGGTGSAYCAYTQERRLLFSQGVTLHVQPDGKTWRQFGMLSGGQQALATLALSLALQALSPCPFYFFDEVDCALDSIAAGRVAAYVKAQCGRVPHMQKSTAAASVNTTNGAPSADRQSAVTETGGLRHRSRGTAAQYLLVSHKPVVFESASCLLGVYSNGRGSSAAVVAHF